MRERPSGAEPLQHKCQGARAREHQHGVMVIGRGTPMLRPSDAKISLRLIETHNFGNGVVMLRYERLLLGPASG